MTKLLDTNKSLIDDIQEFLAVRILLGMIVGIIIGRFCTPNFWLCVIGCLVFFVLILLLYAFRRKRIPHQWNFLNGLSFYGLWIFFGMFLTQYHFVPRPDLQQLNDGIKFGVISSPTEEKPKSYKARLIIQDSIKTEIVAFFEKDTTKPIPEFGDLVAFFSDVKYISNSGNPLEFDYEQYMKLQGVYCQSYIKSNEYEILVAGYQRGIKYYGSKIRERLINIYRESGISGQQLAVLEALTLGYKADLEQETITTFQVSGAMHILAVSGLHTGIILLITNILLSFMDSSKRGKIVKNIIVIIILWLFAAITGFSSSVCRSALMFSLVALSGILLRFSSTYNTLSVSACILLIINPMLLFNVGFGLSYLAVLSIISIMPLTESLIPDIQPYKLTWLQRVGKELWKYFLGIILVSISAQLGTGVLSVRTFQLFPTYFLLTNIIVLPLSYFIMISAVLLLAVSFCAPLSWLVTAILKFLLKILTGSVSWIESLPMSSISDIFINNFQSILLYLCLIFAVIWFHYKRPNFLKLSLASFAVFAISTTFTDWHRNIDNQIVVYDGKYSMLYSIVSDGNMSIIADSAKIDEKTIAPAVKTARLFGIDNIDKCQIGSELYFEELLHNVCGNTFYNIRNPRQITMMDEEPFHIDYLIISKNTYFSATNIIDIFSPKCFIFDSSNSPYYVEKKELELDSLGIKTHYVSRDGAFMFGDGIECFEWFR